VRPAKVAALLLALFHASEVIRGTSVIRGAGAVVAVPVSFAPGWMGMSLVCQPQPGQRNTGEANAEFLQRPAAGDGLGHCFSQFIEFVIHTFPFVLLELFLLRANVRAPINCK
jgi:hypothetical protein